MPEKQTEDRYTDDIALYSGPQRTAKVLKHMLWYRRYLNEMGGIKD